MIVYHFGCETTLLEPRHIHAMVEQSLCTEDQNEEATPDFDALLHLKAHFAVVTHLTVNEIRR